MRFNWIDITDEDFPIIESWLDDETKYFTGLEDGIKDYYDFYLNDEHYIFGDNFWIKVIFENSIPIGLIALYLSTEGRLTVPEFIISQSYRNRGMGTAALTELLNNSDTIIGKSFKSADAVIFPNNVPSQKAFEHAGFIFESSHPDGDAWYYRWTK